MGRTLRRVLDNGSGPSAARLTSLYALLVAANIIVWIWAWALFSAQPALFGAAVLAYTFGLRHAIDADHIAAIDNVVRKLMQEGKRPFAVGFYFSLGHSTVVILAVVVIALTASALQQQFASFRSMGGTIGTAVSASFLLTIGLANLFILRSVWRTFNRVQSGEELRLDHPDLFATGQGVLSRIFEPMLRAVSSPWRMYPLGFLFGLGFDTATEISLLSISATQAVEGLSLCSILVFPALFTAGMALVDTADSILMVGAYGWAFINPVRKLWYNLTITAASVAIAVFIGGVEAGSLIADKLGLTGGFWSALTELNKSLANTGYFVIGLFIASWVLSAAIYQLKGYDHLPISSRHTPLLQIGGETRQRSSEG
jgi:high-affinity nickel-transport protein